MNVLRSTRRVVAAVIVVTVLCMACSSDTEGDLSTKAATDNKSDYQLSQEFDLTIRVSSTKFNETRRIPRKYSCTEENISPPIDWEDVPDGTVSIALLVDSDEHSQHPLDSNQTPDFGSLWTHWVLWGLPPESKGLPEAVPNTPDVPSIAPNVNQGTNSENIIGWTGPCPGVLVLGWSEGHGGNPIKAARSYFFRVYALDINISLDSSATKSEFLKAIDGHIIAGGQLLGEHVSNKQDKCRYAC